MTFSRRLGFGLMDLIGPGEKQQMKNTPVRMGSQGEFSPARLATYDSRFTICAMRSALCFFNSFSYFLPAFRDQEAFVLVVQEGLE